MKPTAAISGLVTSASPSWGDGPCSTDRTSSRPASRSTRDASSATFSLVSGWLGWALTTTGPAGGERGYGVSSHSGEGQREVAGLEHRHRSQRNAHSHQAHSFEDCVIDAIPVLAGVEQLGESADLSGRPGQLSVEALLTQAGLAVGGGDHGVAFRIDGVGDGREDPTAFRRRREAFPRHVGGCRLDCPSHLFRVGFPVFTLRWFAGVWIERCKGSAGARLPRAGDQILSATHASIFPTERRCPKPRLLLVRRNRPRCGIRRDLIRSRCRDPFAGPLAPSGPRRCYRPPSPSATRVRQGRR